MGKGSGTGCAASAQPVPSGLARPTAWRRVLVALVAVALGDVGAVLVVGDEPLGANAAAGGPAAQAPARTEVAGPATPSGRPGSAAAAMGLPTTLDVPALGVRTGLADIVLEPDGALAAPADAAIPGWWSQGTVPGEAGPAVIVGHVDSRTGPGVFIRLRELKPGDPVRVTRDDGKVVTFVVDEVQQYEKAELPTAAVYGPTPEPTLRLITCGGRFDRRSGSYDSNVVVFAHQAEPPSSGRSI